MDKKYSLKHVFYYVDEENITRYKEDYYNGLDKQKAIDKIKYLTNILILDNEVVEPTIESVSRIRLYNNETKYLLRSLDYFKYRYDKYNEFLSNLEKDYCCFYIELSEQYKHCIDDEVKNKTVREYIEVRCT